MRLTSLPLRRPGRQLALLMACAIGGCGGGPDRPGHVPAPGDTVSMEPSDALAPPAAASTDTTDTTAPDSTLPRVLPAPSPHDDAAVPIGSAAPSSATAAPQSRFGETATLRSMARRHGVRIGIAALDNVDDDLFGIPEAATWQAIAAEEYDILTPENAMKMSEIQPERGTFAWARADRIVEFAEAHDMAVHGHTFTWHSQVPDWAWHVGIAGGTQEMRAILREHVGAVVSRYRGRVVAWDVVNEALEEDGTLRHGPWYNALGPGYIGEAFRLAREHDPDATLVYNDYAIALPGPKSDALLQLLADELAAGTPIDAVGFQMHVGSWYSDFDAIAANLARFTALGLEIWITEFDVATDWQLDPHAEAERQATVYGNALRVCLEQPSCKAFQVWGLSDRYANRGAVDALALDERFAPKPAFRALQRTLRDVPVRVR